MLSVTPCLIVSHKASKLLLPFNNRYNYRNKTKKWRIKNPKQHLVSIFFCVRKKKTENQFQWQYNDVCQYPSLRQVILINIAITHFWIRVINVLNYSTMVLKLFIACKPKNIYLSITITSRWCIFLVLA